jgi:hypothetical protein
MWAAAWQPRVSWCALVIGDSLGELIAVHLLRNSSWDTAMFERNEEELTSRGVGLGTHPQLIAILGISRHPISNISSKPESDVAAHTGVEMLQRRL